MILLLCVTLVAGRCVAGGPWVHKPGGGLVSLSFSSLTYSQYHDKNTGGYLMKRAVTDTHLEAYVEWCSLEEWDFNIRLPFKMLSTSTEINADYSGLNDTLEHGILNTFGNASLGIKNQFLSGKWNLAWQLDISIPTDIFESETGLRTGYHATGLLPSIHAGTSGNGWYGFGQFGFNLRSDKYSIEYFANVEAGFSLWNRVWFAGVINLNKSFFNGKRSDGNSVQTGTYLNDREFLAYGVKTWVMATENIGVAYAYYSATMTHNVPAEPVHSFGLFYRWEPWEPQFKQIDGSEYP